MRIRTMSTPAPAPPQSCTAWHPPLHCSAPHANDLMMRGRHAHWVGAGEEIGLDLKLIVKGDESRHSAHNSLITKHDHDKNGQFTSGRHQTVPLDENGRNYHAGTALQQPP